MDNLTHSVVGLAAGELIHRSLPDEPDTERAGIRRRLLLVSCWLASNFPDLDLFLSPLLPPPLGYLLHHRGHTHTVLYALPQILLMWAVIWLFWPSARGLLKKSSSARKGFALALIVGIGLHLCMDYLNSYGIHPFHPYDSRWFFGDMVFILEPLFWVAFGVPLAMTIGPRWPRRIIIALLLVLPLFFTIQGFLLWTSIALLAVVAFVLGWVQRAAGTRGIAGLVLAALVGIGFVGVQSFASNRARLAVAENVKIRNPDGRILDAAMTPYPTNPLCWMFVAIESNESADSYRLQRGLVSLAPQALPVTACPAGFSDGVERHQTTPAIAFLEEEQGDLATLRKFKDENCYFSAWMQFARMPSLHQTEASDMRFSSGLRGNFTTMRFQDYADRECPRHVPGWGFPREDLLTAPAAK